MLENTTIYTNNSVENIENIQMKLLEMIDGWDTILKVLWNIWEFLKLINPDTPDIWPCTRNIEICWTAILKRKKSVLFYTILLSSNSKKNWKSPNKSQVELKRASF